MKKLFFAIFLLCFSVVSFAQQPADKISGIWHSIDSDVGLRFEIYKTNNTYSGKLLWASTMYEADGKTPKNDYKNPDKSLRYRSRQNIVNITNLVYDDGEYTDGKLYNPDDGRTYRLKAQLKNSSELEFRGYVGISLLGQTMKLNRVP
ncbi:DUF2147 domain-containing protein [Spirosoma sp.]|uniref:DUF2147 domain-containing protein n=1 Tax=Spirosoma sp. TaxID=1899569 RepID=UPI003B3B4F2D